MIENNWHGVMRGSLQPANTPKSGEKTQKPIFKINGVGNLKWQAFNCIRRNNISNNLCFKGLLGWRKTWLREARYHREYRKESAGIRRKPLFPNYKSWFVSKHSSWAISSLPPRSSSPRKPKITDMIKDVGSIILSRKSRRKCTSVKLSI